MTIAHTVSCVRLTTVIVRPPPEPPPAAADFGADGFGDDGLGLGRCEGRAVGDGEAVARGAEAEGDPDTVGAAGAEAAAWRVTASVLAEPSPPGEDGQE
ncbi:hypothetical protein [Streptomyces sp. CBMA29]|uniref:hypothetical protein n=1 Tax=Streptomyces sp. CBMA29 TaxID=1896314 RepID=UPI002948BF0E|nr:hypothetical protein [Streptomyces sp. CBMA29]